MFPENFSLTYVALIFLVGEVLIHVYHFLSPLYLQTRLLIRLQAVSISPSFLALVFFSAWPALFFVFKRLTSG